MTNKQEILRFLNIFIKKIIIVILLVITSKASAQNTSQYFRSFAINPATPNDSLYKNINAATNFDAKYKATLPLIKFHQERGNIDSIIYYGNRLYNEIINRKIQHKENNLAEMCHFIAEGKLEKGLYDEALRWFLNGVESTTANSSNEFYIENRIGLGITKYIRGKKEEGKSIIEKCIKIAPNDKLKHDAISKLGIIYYENNELEQSREKLNTAKLFYESKNHVKDMLEIQLWLGKISQKEGNISDALKTYLDVFNRAFSENFFDLYTKSGNLLGTLYLENNDLENAKIILSSVYTNSIIWGNLELEKEAILNLQNAYAKTKDFKNAYTLMTELNVLNNKILTSQNTRQVNELEVQYKTLEQKQEIEKQKSLQTYTLIAFLIILVPIIILLYVYYQKLQTQSKLNETLEKVSQQKIATLLKDQELRLVKASLKGQYDERKRIARELHDSIGGNLAAIKLQVSNKSALNQDNIISQIDNTYDQVRELYHNLMPKKIKNASFTNVLTEYINNIAPSSKEKIILHIHPKDKIDKIETHLKVELYKIIQELLTNALKHAKATQIDIQLSVFNNNAKLLFEDNGIGFDLENAKYGLGLQNLTDRIKTIKGNILINTSPNKGTVIDIDVPLN